MRALTEVEVKAVAGGSYSCDPKKEKGNNGWGNGGNDGVPNRHNAKFDGVDEDRR